MEYIINIVKDECEMSHLLNIYFSNKGWDVSVFSDVNVARQYICKAPHLWIIDIGNMTAEEYGFINEIKLNDKKTPVIFISTDKNPLDKVEVLEMGCDDYLEYPFSHRELMIRVNRLLERVYDRKKDLNREIIKLQEYYVDAGRRVVVHNGEIINLTSKQFDLLFVLAGNQGFALSREQILNMVWGSNYYANDRIVDDMIRRIRGRLKKLKIETIYGFGYRVVK